MLVRRPGSPPTDREQDMFKWAVDMWRQQDNPQAAHNPETFRLMAGIICKTTGLSPIDAVMFTHLAEREANGLDGTFELGELASTPSPSRARRVGQVAELIGRNMAIFPGFTTYPIPNAVE